MPLKISQNSQESTYAGTSGPKIYLNRDSDTGVFLQILPIVLEHFLYGAPPDDCLCKVLQLSILQHQNEYPRPICWYRLLLSLQFAEVTFNT